MLVIADFIIDQNRWVGNYVVPVVGVATLFFCYAVRKERPFWLTGAAVGAALFVVAWAVIYWFSMDWGWAMLIIWVPAFPIQAVFNLILGEDNVVEEHLLIPTAVLMWSVTGAAVAWAINKLKKKPTQVALRMAFERSVTEIKKMKRLILILFAGAFSIKGALILIVLIRDPLVILASPEKVIHAESVTELSRTFDDEYMLRTPSGDVRAFGELSAGSKLIRRIEWPWESAEVIPTYSIVNNIWLLSFQRGGGLLLIGVLLAAILHELKKRKEPNSEGSAAPQRAAGPRLNKPGSSE